MIRQPQLKNQTNLKKDELKAEIAKEDATKADAKYQNADQAAYLPTIKHLWQRKL